MTLNSVAHLRISLKLQRDKLKKYQVRIQIVLDREQEIARQALASGNKQKALIALRQRKYQETILSQTDSQLETLQKLVQSIEFSLVEKDVLFGLKQGNAVLKELHKEMDLETVEKLMSDTAEGIAYQKEIDEMLSSKMSAADEEAVLEEFAALEAEALGTRLPDVPIVPVPEVKVPKQTEEEEEVPVKQEPAREREGRVALAA